MAVCSQTTEKSNLVCSKIKLETSMFHYFFEHPKSSHLFVEKCAICSAVLKGTSLLALKKGEPFCSFR